MATQLWLIDEDPADWRLDPQTRELGRQGVASAREALRLAVLRASARRPDGQEDGHEDGRAA